jgi:hypothetical protein
MTENNTLDKLRNILAKDLPRTTKAERIAQTIREHGAYRWVGVYDVDLDHGLVSNVAWSGPAAPAYPTFPVTKGLTSRAIAEKKTINVQRDQIAWVARNITYEQPIVSTAGSLGGIRKVKLVVIPAAWVEASPAVRAQVAAVHVFANRHFVATCSAENRPNVPL